MADLSTIRTRCLVIDDEPPAREVIKRYIEQIDLLELTAECGNAIQAISILQKQPIDLIFLDIRMPQLNGTDFLKTLKNPPKIIFTTAFAEYALEGYELDVVDYLMKPIRFDRFLKAVNKAFPSHPQQGPAVVGGVVSETGGMNRPAGEDRREDSFVYFRADRKMIKVFLHEILYVESMKDYVKVITTTSTVITKQSISSVEAMLPEKLFVRTHRSYIVALLKIKSFTNELIEVGTASIPVGKLYRQGVMKALE